jgi:hypothetical protein
MLEEAEQRDLSRLGDALPREAARLASSSDPAANPGRGVVSGPAMRALYEQPARAARGASSTLPAALKPVRGSGRTRW